MKKYFAAIVLLFTNASLVLSTTLLSEQGAVATWSPRIRQESLGTATRSLPLPVLTKVTADEWIKYTSPEGRYSVSLPAQPILRTQEVTAATGEKFPQYLAIVVEPGDLVFLTGYYDLVPGMIFSADAVRVAMVKQISGTLVSDTPINLGNYPGRELKVLTVRTSKEPAGDGKPAAKVEYMLRVRFYEVDKRIYVLQVIFPKSLESDLVVAKATRYFDSFRVTSE